MARGISVVVHSEAARQVLTSTEVTGMLGEMAGAIAGKANSMMPDDGNTDERYRTGYLHEADASGNRSHGRVWTASQHAKFHNNKHNTLLKSLDAGRL